MKFKNGREIKANDAVVGLDHCGRVCTGKAIAGSKAKGQDEFVFQNDVHGAVQSSLHLSQFLHAEDAAKLAKQVLADEPAASTAK